MNYKRTETDLPLATEKWGWKYHHLGIPVKDPIPGERHIEHLGIYVKGFETSPFGIELMRFDEHCNIHELIQKIPHLAFEVPDLDEALKGFEIISEPSKPIEGVRVAMIKHNGAPIELMEFKR